jgi:hypothetical protein
MSDQVTNQGVLVNRDALRALVEAAYRMVRYAETITAEDGDPLPALKRALAPFTTPKAPQARLSGNGKESGDA